MVIFAALVFQYILAPGIVNEDIKWWNAYRKIPGMGKQMYKSFIDGCESYQEDESKHDLYVQCVSNSGVYRPTFLSTIFFLCSAIATKSNPLLNREAWPAKYGIFFFLLFITLFIPNHPFFDSIYLHTFRFLAMCFIIIQQIILIDVGYNWNESWVDKSNECDRMEWGSGSKWLKAIIAACITMYSLSFFGIILLYKHFTGCSNNSSIITFTWIGILIITGIQLSGSEGSLLTSSMISLYVTYLAYSIVSKNPNGICNPTLGHDDIWGNIFGMFLTIISLAWVGWSWTAEDRLDPQGVQAARPVGPNARPNPDNLNLDTPFLDSENQAISGIVVESEDADDDLETSSPANYRGSTSLWKLNIVLALISCWVAASLTGWGCIEGGIGEAGMHTAANPQVGLMNMTMIGVSQWLAIILYGWTLLAPRIFPDREFS
eukprot:CAMPEP_0184869168 /NCGR_PEP_ID=MMETSP0580-20130426/33192_1 /TAXON_ID=1118495 /ORGANISM="Dactyliosolen fragilissimus" /LENGTH=432 /DNA_ID=CAMNT_0027370487 /DNA_START=242 /DNA_END=1540 /DNA_ORIENTATION=+